MTLIGPSELRETSGRIWPTVHRSRERTVTGDHQTAWPPGLRSPHADPRLGLESYASESLERSGQSAARFDGVLRVRMWSNGHVFVRIWEYEVPEAHLDPFVSAYAADGAWAELFGRSRGFVGTELYKDRTSGGRFVTIDRWVDEERWKSFLNEFQLAYQTLDIRLEGLASSELPLFEGNS